MVKAKGISKNTGKETFIYSESIFSTRDFFTGEELEKDSVLYECPNGEFKTMDVIAKELGFYQCNVSIPLQSEDTTP